MPRPLVDLTARRDDPRPAVRIADTALTREALAGAALAVAEQIAGAGVVAVHATASAETIVAVLGGLLAGVPVVAVPPDVGTAERAHVLADSGAELWLGEPVDGAQLEQRPIDVHAVASPTLPLPPPEATALLMYTSGTTGPPKGAVLSHGALAASIDGLAEAWEWTAADVLVHGLPLFHVHGLVLGVLGPLRVGSPLVHTVRPQPAAYADAVIRHGGSLLFGVPTVWSRIADDPAAAQALRPARLLVSGSAPLPVPVAERLGAQCGHVPIERYGMTETVITISQRAAEERRPGWVGRPIRGVETRLVDDEGAAVPHDGETPGNLHVRGATLFDGYHGREHPLLPGGWFDTGDIAAIDAGGEHRIVGRKSTDLIKSGGYRIGAGEIETSLLGRADVAEVAVVGLPDADLGQRIVAFVVAREGREPTEQALVQHVAEQLSAHKRPREVRFVDSLPRNAMGKVQKRRLI